MRVVITTEDIYAKLMQVLVFLVKTQSNLMVFRELLGCVDFNIISLPIKIHPQIVFQAGTEGSYVVRGPVRVTTLS